jgi:hypothetical protein
MLDSSIFRFKTGNQPSAPLASASSTSNRHRPLPRHLGIRSQPICPLVPLNACPRQALALHFAAMCKCGVRPRRGSRARRRCAGEVVVHWSKVACEDVKCKRSERISPSKPRPSRDLWRPKASGNTQNSFHEDWMDEEDVQREDGSRVRSPVVPDCFDVDIGVQKCAACIDGCV